MNGFPPADVAWGALGPLNFPSSLIIYFVIVDMLEKARMGRKPPHGSADGPSGDTAGSSAASRTEE